MWSRNGLEPSRLVALGMLLLVGALAPTQRAAARHPAIFNKATKPWPARLYGSYRVHRDLMYARHVSALMDVYLPARPMTKAAGAALQKRKLPCILFIQGQGFAQCNRRYLLKYCEPLHYGFAMAAIAYRTTDEAVFPSQVHDCREAVRFLRRQARLLGIDGSRIGVWGLGHGGNLAAMVAATGNVKNFMNERAAHPGSAAVAACAAWFAPTDLTTIERQLWCLFRSESPSYHPLRKMERYERYVDGPLAEKVEVLRAASPINYLDISDPPFLLHHGYSDIVVPRQQSIDFAAALKKAGVPVELVLMPFAGHGFTGRDVRLDHHHPKRRVLSFFQDRLQATSTQDGSQTTSTQDGSQTTSQQD